MAEPINQYERLAQQVRDALGDYNDFDQPITTLIKNLRRDRARLLNQLICAKPDAERYRKLLMLGNGWLAEARKKAGTTLETVSEQLDNLTNWDGIEIELPKDAGSGYRIPETPTALQLTSVCISLRSDYGLMGPVERDKLQRKAKSAWCAIAKEINEAGPQPVVKAAAGASPGINPPSRSLNG